MNIKKLVEETGFEIKEFPGNNGNTYSWTKKLYSDIKVNEDTIIYSSHDRLNESKGEDFEFSGGVIVFSTDVNSKQLSENKLINWCKQKLVTVLQRISYKKKLDKVALDKSLEGWTIGRFLLGKYKDKNNNIFDENSISVEIAGVDTEALIKVAESISEEFLQESCLVKDYNTGKIYFVYNDNF